MRRTAARFLLASGVAIAVVAAGAPLPAQAAPARTGHGPEYRNVGYFTQWGIYGRSFYVKNLDTSGAAKKLSHINYAFGAVNAEGRCVSADEWADFQRPVGAAESVDGVADAPGQAVNGNFNQLLKLKKKHPHLKVLISLGGWTLSDYFSDAALPEKRQAFVTSCVDLFIKGVGAGVFDGIDLDWEWPNWPGEPGNIIRPEDKQNFTGLVAEFRSQLDATGRKQKKHYELTAFLPANPAAIDAGIEVRKVFRQLDFATVQGYDFHGSWETVTNQQSALRRPAEAPDDPDFTVERTVEAYLSRGAPRNEIVVGIPYYGQGWTGVSGGGDGLYQPATGPAPGVFSAGVEDYKTLAQLPGKGFTVHRDLRNGHAWLFDGTTMWTYDDPFVVFQKALYIRTQGLGGAMVWSLDGDDANATLTKTIGLGLSR